MTTTTTEHPQHPANGATQLTTGLADAPTTSAAKAKGTVELRSPHERGLVERALTHHAEDLKKLAEKNRGEGYDREARTIDADATTIQHALLPQVREQREFALVSPAAFERAVEEAIRTYIFRAFDGLDLPGLKITKQGIVGRRDRLVTELRDRIVLYARDVAQHSWDAGYQFRQLSPDVLANTPIRTLTGRAD